jgi:phosphohistidine phosphatase
MEVPTAMKTLLLLRHAKSSWDDASLADFDRQLAERGRKSAPKVGKELASRGWLPDIVLVSPSVRTRQTWGLVAAELSRPPKAAFPKTLYMASPELLLQKLRRTSKKADTLLMIGHNPGMEALAERLAGAGSDAGSLARLKEKFPTAALARFTFDGAWTELDFGVARLTDFLRPKDLV